MTDYNSAAATGWAADGETPRDDPDARVDQLTNEIDETRGDLSETLEAIGDKLDPGNIAREASHTVRTATIGKVEQMTYGAQETWRDMRTGNTGSIVDTITSNPIPAGMVAVGLGMLFLNRGKQSGYGGDVGRRGRWDGRQYVGGGYGWESSDWDRRATDRSAADRVGGAVSGAGEQIGDLADQAGRKVGELTGTIGQTADRLPQQASWYVEQGGSQVSRFIDENPLGAGVIAVAAGAAIGMLLPTTPMERDAMGPARDQLVDKVEGTVHQALDKVDDQVDRQSGEAVTTP
jgi:ElaB/YqjD/DUF883 family membrane-anchored ribosome-binding protein